MRRRDLGVLLLLLLLSTQTYQLTDDDTKTNSTDPTTDTTNLIKQTLQNKNVTNLKKEQPKYNQNLNNEEFKTIKENHRISTENVEAKLRNFTDGENKEIHGSLLGIVNKVVPGDAMKKVGVDDSIKIVSVEDETKKVRVEAAMKKVGVEDALKKIDGEDAIRKVVTEDPIKITDNISPKKFVVDRKTDDKKADDKIKRTDDSVKKPDDTIKIAEDSVKKTGDTIKTAEDSFTKSDDTKNIELNTSHTKYNKTMTNPTTKPDNTLQTSINETDFNQTQNFGIPPTNLDASSDIIQENDYLTTEDTIERTMPLLTDDPQNDNYEKIEHRVSLGQDSSLPDADLYSVEQREIEDAVDYGLRKMHELVLVKEPELYRKGLWLDRNNPAMFVAAFNAPSEKALKLARYGYASLQAATKLAKRHSIWGRNNPELRESLRDTRLHTDCPLRGRPRCRPAARRYRTADGTCNNFENPWRGAANTPQQRFLPPRYDDGLQTIRRSVFGGPLPSPRLLSTSLHIDRDIEMPSITLMLMQWGQFVDHDMTASAMGRGFNGSVPLCCENGGTGFQRPEFMHPDCLPIQVPDDDWFFERLGIKCLEFVRSAPTSRIDCDLGWREQINQVTSFIDASQIYGNSASQADSQRTFRGGRVQYHRLDNQNPPDPPGGDVCTHGAITSSCFRPGDGRVSEQPALTSFHIIWIRKHNQLAELLERANPHWSDEKIYQETRRVIGAMMQHITYREFLPIVLGQEVMTLFDLDLIPKGYYTGYDSNVDPSAANSFTAAAFRFGHSLVQKSFIRFDPFHRPLFNNVTLHEEQTNHENIWSRGSVDRLILGMSNQGAQRRDEFVTEELTNHLFQPPGFPFGMDLASINVQRGRDHGIPPYIAWRIPCGLSKIESWEDLNRVMLPEAVLRFRSIYTSVDDVDLYSGGLAEKPVRGGLVGPTFACIIAQQFSNLRKGDRFWYENGNFENSFTPAQLQQIRKITFSEVICDTMPEIQTIQPFVFMASSMFSNRRKSCRNLRSFKVDPWIENFRQNFQREATAGDERISKSRFTKKDSLKPLKNTNVVGNIGDKLNAGEKVQKILINKNNIKEGNVEPLRTPDTQRSETIVSQNRVLEDRSGENLDPLRPPNLKTDKNDDSLNIKSRRLSDLKQFRRNRRLFKRSLSSIPFFEVLSNFSQKDDKIDDDSDKLSTKQLDDDDDEVTDRASKRKKPNTRRKKPSRKTNSTIIVNNNRNKVKVKNLSTPAPNEKNYYAEYHYTVDHLPDPPTFRPITQRPISSVRPPHNGEISILVPAQNPNDLNYLINTVTKRPVSKTTKPDYNIHIQINYYLNSTAKPKPDFEDDIHNYDNPNLPYIPGQDFPDQTGYVASTTTRPSYTTKRPTKRPYYSTTKRPYVSTTTYYSTTKKKTYYPTTNSYYSTTKKPYYSSTTTYYSTTKRPYYTTTKPYYSTTKRPSYTTTERPYYTTTKRPYFISNSHPLSVVYPSQSQPTKRPNVVILGEENPIRPNYPYHQVNDYYRPNYDYQSSYEAKRPVLGTVIKIDQTPSPIPPTFTDQEHTFELPHKIYYVNNNYKPNYSPIDLTKVDVDDKIDFRPFYNGYHSNYQQNKPYIQVTTVTNHRPYDDDDSRFVKISSVRGHTTSTKNLGPVIVSVQQKEGDGDLELNYSDIYEMFAKPENGTFLDTKIQPSNIQEWKVFNDTEEESNQPVLPKLKLENETATGEYPKPMHKLLQESLEEELEDLII